MTNTLFGADLADDCIDRCVSDAGGRPAWLSAGLQRPGPTATHASRVAAAITQPRLRPLYSAQRACWGNGRVHYFDFSAILDERNIGAYET